MEFLQGCQQEAEEVKIWEYDIKGLYKTNALTSVSIKTLVKEANKFMVYKVNKENADVISVITKSHPVDREVTDSSEAIQDAKSQSSSSTQEQGLPGAHQDPVSGVAEMIQAKPRRIMMKIQEQLKLAWMLSSSRTQGVL